MSKMQPVKVQPARRGDVSQKPVVSLEHQAFIPHGVTLKSVLDPNYWCNVADLINEQDEIRLVWYDGTLVVWCYVKTKTPTTLTLLPIQKLELEPVAKGTIEVGEYLVKWQSPHKEFQYVVMDKKKNIVLKGFDTKGKAMDAAEDLVKKIAA